MEPEDLEPRMGPAKKTDLAPLSIDELEGLIVDHQAEIERIKAEIQRKKAHRDGVASLFKD